MTFPLIFLLIPYVVFLCIWLFLSLVGFYHLMRYSGRRFINFILGIIYFVGCVVLLQLSYMYLSPIDWNQPITIFKNSLESSTFMDLEY